MGLSSQIFLVSKRQAGESRRERETQWGWGKEREREVFTRVSSGRHPLAEEGAS